MAAATVQRQIDLAHEEGDTYSTPISVYVYGHDIDEDEARQLAQDAMDAWAIDHDDDEDSPRHLVAKGAKTHLRKVPAAHGSEYEGNLLYHAGYPAGPGASPIWEFEVDEHLVPRCEITGCNIRWSRGPGHYFPVRMCASHARLNEVLYRVEVAQRMLQIGWILGEPETGDYFGQWTEQQRRDYAIEHLDGAIKSLSRSLRETATTIADLAVQGFTLPLDYEITTDAADAAAESEIS